MNKTDYKRLGDYIREVDVRNRDSAVTKLMGINIGKYFMSSVANVIGTDLSNYKVVSRNCFACNLMHVGRDKKLPIALLDSEEKIIVSPAYFVFEISKPKELLPAYLMMWFRRSEFDRNAWFYTDSDVRGGMSREAFCDMQLPIPPISRQREIIVEYETLTRRIRFNERLIAALESAARTLYRRTFLENPNPSWRTGTIGEFCKKMTSGGTPSRSCEEYWNSPDYPWMKTGEVQNNVIFDVEEYISRAGLENSSAKLVPAGTVVMAMYGGGNGQQRRLFRY